MVGAVEVWLKNNVVGFGLWALGFGLWALGFGLCGDDKPVVAAGAGGCQMAGNKKGSLAPLGYDLLLVLLHQAKQRVVKPSWLHPCGERNSVNVMKSYLC
ncbi:hypothetical protein [Aeromonas allosaccharophila]|uniref:hypothetical protein n=1 Tax=Aeromonas allosaccharophila TaxID=656 RepID=UPI002B48E8E0|nr:hypothetical protein [Aeromonas allosaccharophila]